MKRLLFTSLLSVFCFYTLKAQAQGSAVTFDNGAPVRITTYTDVQGSPYLSDSWLQGSVTTAEGKSYKDLKIKYDQMEDKLYFLGNDGVTAMKFNDIIKEFSIKTNDNYLLFRNGYPPLKSSNKENYYEVLVEGRVQLLKKNLKKITQSREYNSATSIKRIIDNTNYFVFVENQLIAITKDKKFFQSLSGHTTETLNILNDKTINLKKEEDLIKVIKTFK